jgi:hypothetical protein
VIGFESNNSTLILWNDTFENNYVTQNGVVYINKGRFQDFRSKYYYNAGIFGGAINLKDSQDGIALDNTIFVNNYAVQGGTIYL